MLTEVKHLLCSLIERIKQFIVNSDLQNITTASTITSFMSQFLKVPLKSASDIMHDESLIVVIPS